MDIFLWWGPQLTMLCLVFFLVRRAAARRRTNKLHGECVALAAQAKAALEEDDIRNHELLQSYTYISNALSQRDASLLRAYVNLVRDHSAFRIRLAVTLVTVLTIDGRKSSLTPETLTSEHVTTCREVLLWVDTDDYDEDHPDTNANRVALYAMEHLEDAPVILDIIGERGITELDEIRKVLIEIRNSPSAALSGGEL